MFYICPIFFDGNAILNFGLLTFEGQFKNGRPSGYCKLKVEDRPEMEGNFVDGYLDGIDVMPLMSQRYDSIKPYLNRRN